MLDCPLTCCTIPEESIERLLPLLNFGGESLSFEVNTHWTWAHSWESNPSCSLLQTVWLYNNMRDVFWCSIWQCNWCFGTKISVSCAGFLASWFLAYCSLFQARAFARLWASIFQDNRSDKASSSHSPCGGWSSRSAAHLPCQKRKGHSILTPPSDGGDQELSDHSLQAPSSFHLGLGLAAAFPGTLWCGGWSKKAESQAQAVPARGLDSNGGQALAGVGPGGVWCQLCEALDCTASSWWDASGCQLSEWNAQYLPIPHYPEAAAGTPSQCRPDAG